tara:strand:- start:2265 stop:2603 length:339 start_codon:yes stop_codon:yes gene_type:complete
VDGDLSETSKPKTARSYRATVVGDNTVVSINLKWLGQMFVLVASLIYGYYRIETRITNLERGIQIANDDIQNLVSKHMIKEEKERTEMEERISFFERELNLNPFSWKKKRKK